METATLKTLGAATAVLAGLAVAVAFGLVGLEIHYELTPGQAWAP